jgi:Flp pilus assembly protein TadG
MRARVRRADAGAAVVDFVMMSTLLIMLLFAVLQVAIYFYARNVAAASAADAARYTAVEGIDPGEGGARAEALIRQGLDDADASSIHCTGALGRDAASGLATTTVHCTGHLRLLFLPLHLPLTIDVTSSALKEHHP